MSGWASRAGIAATAVLAAALLVPVVVTAAGAFADLERSTAELFRSVVEVWGRSLARSVQVVGVVVPLALLIGAPAAWAFQRLPFPGSRLLETAALVPLALPGVALGFSLLHAAAGAPRFWLLVAGHLAYTVPLVVKTVGNGIDGLDPLVLEASRSLGAGPWQTTLRVTLPLLTPSLILSALLVFAVSWGEFNVSFLLADSLLQTFPSALYLTYTTGSFPVAAAATLVFLLPVVPALIAIQALGGEELHRGLQV